MVERHSVLLLLLRRRRRRRRQRRRHLLPLLVQPHLALLLVHLRLQPVDLRAQLRALAALRIERPPDLVHRHAV